MSTTERPQRGRAGTRQRNRSNLSHEERRKKIAALLAVAALRLLKGEPGQEEDQSYLREAG